MGDDRILFMDILLASFFLCCILQISINIFLYWTIMLVYFVPQLL